jgi:hypothetical protein
MLFLGGALKQEYRGKTYDKIASQTDLTSTILRQLNMPDTAFQWSKNLMNPYTKEFAYFELNQGFGWIKPEGYIAYDHFNQRFLTTTISDTIQRKEALVEGASYLQTLFQEYIDL